MPSTCHLWSFCIYFYYYFNFKYVHVQFIRISTVIHNTYYVSFHVLWGFCNLDILLVIFRFRSANFSNWTGGYDFQKQVEVLCWRRGLIPMRKLCFYIYQKLSSQDSIKKNSFNIINYYVYERKTILYWMSYYFWKYLYIHLKVLIQQVLIPS